MIKSYRYIALCIAALVALTNAATDYVFPAGVHEIDGSATVAGSALPFKASIEVLLGASGGNVSQGKQVLVSLQLESKQLCGHPTNCRAVITKMTRTKSVESDPPAKLGDSTSKNPATTTMSTLSPTNGSPTLNAVFLALLSSLVLFRLSSWNGNPEMLVVFMFLAILGTFVHAAITVPDYATGDITAEGSVYIWKTSFPFKFEFSLKQDGTVEGKLTDYRTFSGTKVTAKYTQKSPGVLPLSVVPLSKLPVKATFGDSKNPKNLTLSSESVTIDGTVYTIDEVLIPKITTKLGEAYNPDLTYCMKLAPPTNGKSTTTKMLSMREIDVDSRTRTCSAADKAKNDNFCARATSAIVSARATIKDWKNGDACEFLENQDKFRYCLCGEDLKKSPKICEMTKCAFKDQTMLLSNSGRPSPFLALLLVGILFRLG